MGYWHMSGNDPLDISSGTPGPEDEGAGTVPEPEPNMPEYTGPPEREDSLRRSDAEAYRRLRRRYPRGHWWAAFTSSVMIIAITGMFVASLVALGIYLYTREAWEPRHTISDQAVDRIMSEVEDHASAGQTVLRMSYPVGDHIIVEQRLVERASDSRAVAEATLRAFLTGPSGFPDHHVPRDADYLGLYFGSDGVLYIDFADSFRGNFQGDTLAELLLLKALNESVKANVFGIKDVKVLVAGRELDTLGGHIMLRGTLGEVLANNLWAEALH